jgi:hypothetical protein
MCTESQQLNSSIQDEPTEEMQDKRVKENNAERMRAMAKERSRRFREKKRLNVLKSVHHVVSYFSLLPCDVKHTQFFIFRHDNVY